MDMTTSYMGLTLSSPLIAGASPLSETIENIRALARAGAGAIVMHSVFEEQIELEARALDYYLEQGTNRFAESLDYFPPMESFPVGPAEYLEHLSAAVEAVDVPVIASLNGVSAGGWIDYAEKIQQAGARGLELNVYLIPTNPSAPGEQIEQAHVDVLKAVKSVVSIPVAVKLSPFFSAPAHVARRLDEAGADALVLFNRFYQPDFDLEKLEVTPALSLSSSAEARLPLRWIAILFGRVRASLAGTSGVHTGADAAKLILAGADAVQMVSALLENGIDHLAKVAEEMAGILQSKGYASVRDARGVLSQRSVAEPAVFERANYMKALTSWARPWGMDEKTSL